MRPKKTHQAAVVSLTSWQLSLSFTSGWLICSMAILSQMSHMASGEKKKKRKKTFWGAFLYICVVACGIFLLTFLARWNHTLYYVHCDTAYQSHLHLFICCRIIPHCTQPCRPGEEGQWKPACIPRLPLPCNFLGFGSDRSQVKTASHLRSHTYNLPAAWEDRAADVSH